MNARAKEKLYGGYTAAELRARCATQPWADVSCGVVLALLDEIEAASAPEVVTRLRRIETKLHKLSLHSGAEPNAAGETTVTIAAGRPLVHVGGYDTTLAQIKHVVEALGVAPGATLYLLERDSLLGTLRLTGNG